MAPTAMMRVMSSTAELVNPIPADEIDGWARSMGTTFLRPPDHGDPWIAGVRRLWNPARAWGARERGRWVATLRTEERHLTVPGAGDDTADLAVDALTNVTVAATHRRRGLMSAMLTDALTQARDRGDPLSILIAAEWPIYGRFGYAPATLAADYVLHRSRRGSTPPGDPGRVRQVDRETFGDVAPAVFDAARRERAGQVDRDPPWWDRVLGRDGYAPSPTLPHNWFVHEGDDGPDGLVAWTAAGPSGLVPPLGWIDVWGLTSASPAAYRDLWAYLSGIDGIDQVRAADRPVDEPVRWLLPDARTLVMTQQVDLLWLRLLDVPAALSARRYAVAGAVVLEVVDDDPPGGVTGRYALRAGAGAGAESEAGTGTGGGGPVHCERTEAAADLIITQRALASIYLGGFRLRELLVAGAATERTPGALALVDLMFSTSRAPWNTTWF